MPWRSFVDIASGGFALAVVIVLVELRTRTAELERTVDKLEHMIVELTLRQAPFQ